MSFKLLLLPPFAEPDWPDQLRDAVPGIDVTRFDQASDAAEAIVDADAAYGTVPPDLLARAERLRWIAAPMAGLGEDWFYPELVASAVQVTNLSGIYNEALAGHIMGFVLAFARRLDVYLPIQAQHRWERQRGVRMIDLGTATTLIVGVGGSGAEAARLCAAFGMHVIGVDPRRTEAPEGVAVLVGADELDRHLPDADFVIVTTPETPETRGMFDAARFARMKRGAYFINVARGALVVTDDLADALESGQLAGAGLDVVDPEPLPPSHRLWTAPGLLLTPHVAIAGAPDLRSRRLGMLVENCRRFAAGDPLVNVVDKANWF